MKWMGCDEEWMANNGSWLWCGLRGREAHKKEEIKEEKKNKALQATMRSEDPLAMIGNCMFLFRAKGDCGIKSEVIINMD